MYVWLGGLYAEPKRKHHLVFLLATKKFTNVWCNSIKTVTRYVWKFFETNWKITNQRVKPMTANISQFLPRRRLRVRTRKKERHLYRSFPSSKSWGLLEYLNH